MELDELKSTWTVLDEQLKKNEMLNKRIIKEMLCKKSSKSLSLLINSDFFNIIILLSAIPICIWQYNIPFFKNTFFPKILFILCIVICPLAAIWTCFKIVKYLSKIDFTNSIKNNMQYINTYAIFNRKEKIISYFILIPIIYLLGVMSYYELNVNLSLWIFLIVAFIVGLIISYWFTTKIYDSNIESIKKSLEELEELKD